MLRARGAKRGQTLVPPKGGPYPHADDAKVRRLLHRLRAAAIEGFSGQFKAIFDAGRPVPTRGLLATSRFVLGAVLVYQPTPELLGGRARPAGRAQSLPPSCVRTYDQVPVKSHA